MEPTIGRIVHYTFNKERVGGFSTEAGQTQTVPAIVVAVWGGPQQLVNLRVFTDSDGPTIVETSVPIRDENSDPDRGFFWEWPTRD